MSSKPEQGDVYWADPDPTRGSEQAKSRPFAIVSVDQLNRSRIGLSLAVPLTRTDFENALHLAISPLEGGHHGCPRHKLTAPSGPELPHRSTVGRRDEGFTTIQLPHDLATVVTQLALGYDACQKRSVAWVLPIVFGVEGCLDCVSAPCQLPRVRFALGLSLAVVLDQSEALQTVEQLRHLALVCDTGDISDLAVAGTGLGADRGEHTRGAEGDADREILERVTRMLGGTTIAR